MNFESATSSASTSASVSVSATAALPSSSSSSPSHPHHDHNDSDTLHHHLYHPQKNNMSMPYEYGLVRQTSLSSPSPPASPIRIGGANHKSTTTTTVTTTTAAAASSSSLSYSALETVAASRRSPSSLPSPTSSSSPLPFHLQHPNTISIDEAIERLGMGRFQHGILVAAGLCFAADSMEVLLLSFLAVVLQVEWNLPASEAATLTSVVFLGALLGTLVLGPLGDAWGRKPIFTITAAIIAIFGFATAAVNSFGALLLIRFFVGFGVGGLTVPFDTLAEFMPLERRGASLLLVEYFWTAGTLLTPVVAYFTLGQGGNDNGNAWRLFVIVSAVPCLLSTVIGIYVVPESPRWLLLQGKHDTALDILRKAAEKNGRHALVAFPPGTRLVLVELHHYHIHQDDDDDADNAMFSSATNTAAPSFIATPTSNPREECWANFRELFSPSWRRITILLWTAWAGSAFVYYGTIMVITRVFASTSTSTTNTSSSSSYSFDYGAILASASAEIAGTTLVILTVDKIGRVVAQSASYALGGMSVLTLCLLAAAANHNNYNNDSGDTSSSSSSQHARMGLVLAAFAARLFFMAATCTTWVSTAEILTTDIRATGHAASNAVARIGGSLSPFLISSQRAYPTIGALLLLVSLMSCLATSQLPETAGRALGVSDPREREANEDDSDNNNNNNTNMNNDHYEHDRELPSHRAEMDGVVLTTRMAASIIKSRSGSIQHPQTNRRSMV